MSDVWTPVGGNGGLPSDMLTDERANYRRLKVSDDALKTSYGEALVSESSPVIQISSDYGLSESELTAVSGGSATADNGVYAISTGTGANSASAIVSYREIRQRAGQGIAAIFSAAFTAGQQNSTQKAGFISSESDFTFGFSGEQFGIFYSKDGSLEIQKLTITTPAAATETAIIVVDGITHNVNLTAATAEKNAFDIAKQLTALDGRYRFTSNGVTVEAIANLPDFGGGNFSFTSGTAAADWAEISNGVVPSEVFYPKEQWNIDSAIEINETFMNKYKVQFQGNIYFYIEHPKTGKMTAVHVIEYLGTTKDPSIDIQTFRVGWAARNAGNTTDIVINADEASAFVEGKISYNQLSTSASNFQQAGSVATNLISLRNRTVFRGRPNRVEAIPLVLSFGTDYNKPVIFEVIANPIVADANLLDWEYLDEQNSIMEVAKNSVAITGGIVVQTFTVVGSKDVNIGELIGFHSPLASFAITARISASAQNLCAIGATWKEDK